MVNIVFIINNTPHLLYYILKLTYLTKKLKKNKQQFFIFRDRLVFFLGGGIP